MTLINAKTYGVLEKLALPVSLIYCPPDSKISPNNEVSAKKLKTELMKEKEPIIVPNIKQVINMIKLVAKPNSLLISTKGTIINPNNAAL